MQSLPFDCYSENTTGAVAPLTQTVVLDNSLNLRPGTTFIKGVSAQISTRIPNIYKYTPHNFDNTVIRVKRNVADAWTTINLTAGIYKTVSEIEAAVTGVVNAWYVDPTNNPALKIQANYVTDQVYIVLDSSALAAGGTQMCVDLSQSKIAWTLGFPDATTYIVDGIYTSSLVVNMDTQGTIVNVVNSLSNIRVVNNAASKVMMTVPMVAMTGVLEFIWPGLTNSQSSAVLYTGSQYISTYRIEFKTAQNKDVVFLPGSRAYVQFELIQ